MRAAVVSRDDLLASCWGGLALGDDVINRWRGERRRFRPCSSGGRSRSSKSRLDAALAALRPYVSQYPRSIPDLIGFIAGVGRIDQAFAVLETFFAPYANPDGQRLPATNLLFRAPLKPLRADARFARLTRAVGLDN